MSKARPNGAVHHRPIGGKAAATARPPASTATTGTNPRGTRKRSGISLETERSVDDLALERLGDITG